MSNPLFIHEVVEYAPGQPFRAIVATSLTVDDANNIYVNNSHWHEDLEIAYNMSGHCTHYIDGRRIEAVPGSLVVTNCESIHCIQPHFGDSHIYGNASTVVLLVDRRYLESVFPELKKIIFTNDNVAADVELCGFMEKFAWFSRLETHPLHSILRMQGLLLQVIASLLENRSARSERRKNPHIDTLKEVLCYLAEHFREPVTQAEMAKMFYFSPQNFSRFMKHGTGRTFLEHLTSVRLEHARADLMYTDKLVRDIAVDNGFPNDKSFIRAFKNVYTVTPLQFRMQMISGNERKMKDDKK